MMTIDWEKVQAFLEQLSGDVCDIVGPISDEVSSQSGASGDIVSKRDEEAAALIRERLRESSPYPCALIDEDSAQLEPLHDDPVLGLIADPIDGTRPSLMGMKDYTSTLAAFSLDSKKQLQDVQVCAVRCADGELFSARRGAGVWHNAKKWEVPRRPDLSISNARIHFDFAGGELGLAGAYLAPLTESYLNGFVVINSSAYSITRLLRGTVDVDIHIGAFLRRQWGADFGAIFERVSHSVAGAHIWDLAPIYLLVKEAGGNITRVDGSSFDDARLDDKPPLEAYDIAAAIDPELHEQVVGLLMDQHRHLTADRGFAVGKHGRFVFAPWMK